MTATTAVTERHVIIAAEIHLGELLGRLLAGGQK